MKAELEGLIDELRHNPGDDTVRAILADLLDEIGPTPVKSGKLPKWLMLCWVRLADNLLRRRRKDFSAFAISNEINELLGSQDIVASSLDHWGTTTISGLECFVSEPYAYEKDAPRLFRVLADVLPCCAHAYSRRAAHFPSCVRAILFPPLEMPQPKRGKKQ